MRARTIMHMRTDKIESLLMNQLVIENMHALLLSIIRTGASSLITVRLRDIFNKIKGIK